MVTEISSAKRQEPVAPTGAMREAVITAAPARAMAAPEAIIPKGIDPLDFVRANRIHIKDGSLFIDPYLVLHPRELAPENETALRKKLQLTYSINNPSFFESSERTTIALNLGQILPVSPDSKRSKMLEDINTLNREIDSGRGSEQEKELINKRAPFAAIVRNVVDHPTADPVGVEVLKNSLAVYLLVREKLTANGYLGKLTDYVQHTASPDQVMADLTAKIGVTPIMMRQAALQGGLDGIGKLLGLDPKYVSDVRELAEYAATQDFSYNLVEHWHLGRQLQGLKAPMQEKILTGIDARITAKIAEYRDRIRHHFEVPDPVKNEEIRIAEALNLVDPTQRELMYRLGYEICFSPDLTADDIAFFKGINGLHRKAANDLRDVQGTYRIYFAGRGDLKNSMRTLVHEVAHNLWPDQFSATDVKNIDALAMSDQQRFTRFEQMMTQHYSEFEKLFNAYKAGNDAEKAAVIATTNERFAAYGFRAEGLFPYLREAHDFRFAVRHAFDTLSIEGSRYNHSGYASPEERFREVISRFAELSQVEYRGEPQFLQFLAPGLNQVFEGYYLPHLARFNEALKSGTMPLFHQDTKTQRDSATTPKVEEHPTAPHAPAPVRTNPSTIDEATPSTLVTAPAVRSKDVNAALNALSTMGISPSF